MTLGDEARGRGGGESAHLSAIKGINKRSDREWTGGRDEHGERRGMEGLQRISPEQSKENNCCKCMSGLRAPVSWPCLCIVRIPVRQQRRWLVTVVSGGGGAEQIRLQERERLREAAQLNSVPMVAEASTLLNQS